MSNESMKINYVKCQMRHKGIAYQSQPGRRGTENGAREGRPNGDQSESRTQYRGSVVTPKNSEMVMYFNCFVGAGAYSTSLPV